MDLSRRELLTTIGAGALVLGAGRTVADAAPEGAPDATPDIRAAREHFPRTARKLWLAAAEVHPFGVHHERALAEYTQRRMTGPGPITHSFSAERQVETKKMFADLIHATPDEIAFVPSTTDGENIIVGGMDLAARGGNVVIDDLHFSASKYLYEALKRDHRIDVRVVRHRNWKIDPADMAKAIDKNTRLVSLALVSNINGFMHEVRTVSDLAHANGAYLYADIIQAVGCTPVDVQAMGIDFGACTTYKWLMGDFGFGFLYVRKDLQDSVVKPRTYGLRQVRETEGKYEPLPGAIRYEGNTSFAYLPAACAYEGLKYVTGLGLTTIRTHAKRLTDRLQKEMPALGYPSITPLDNPTPIVSFIVPNPDATQAKLDRAFGERIISLRRWEESDPARAGQGLSYMRIGVSVYNNDADLDQFFTALKG